MKMSEGMLGLFLNSKDDLIMLQTPRYSWNIAKVNSVKLWHVATCIINLVFQPYPPGYLKLPKPERGNHMPYITEKYKQWLRSKEKTKWQIVHEILHRFRSSVHTVQTKRKWNILTVYSKGQITLITYVPISKLYRVMVFLKSHFQQHFRYTILPVSFTGGDYWHVASHWQALSHVMLCRVHIDMRGIRTHNVMWR